MRVIAIANSKGGSAKTTTAIHLAVGIARQGLRVLLIDMDPQGHVAEGLGLDVNALEGQRTVADIIDRTATIPDVAIACAGLALVPATDQLAYTEFDLRDQFHREDRLKDALQAVAADYDYGVIDCPPYLNLLTVNAFAAAQTVLIPMVAEYYALKGVARLLAAIDRLKRDINPPLTVLGVLFTRVSRTVNAREIMARAKTELADYVPFFELMIPETVRIREAAALGKTIYDHDPESPAARAYRDLTHEVVAHG